MVDIEELDSVTNDMPSSDKIFSLEGKGLKLDTAADLEPHITQLMANPHIEEVRMLGNTLGIGACKLLGEVLATKKSLQIANLADIFTGRLLNEIPEALSSLLTSILNLPNLHTINLNDNAFGLNTQAPLVAFLAAHVPLQHLYLNNNGLGPHAGILIADALSELHAKKVAARKDRTFSTGVGVPDLETVICGRNRLENGSMTAWAKCFSLHNKVKQVKMVQNGIRQEGISHLLAEGLRHADSLEVLDLQDNTFTLLAAKVLAEVVLSWTALTELGIGDSLLSAKGGILLGQALAKGKNDKLEILRLQYNDITAAGLAEIASAAKSGLPKLKKVEINGNKLSEEDASIIALQDLLEERKERFGGDIILEDEWGLDSLSDLEDESDEEEEDEEDEEPEDVSSKERAEKLIQEAEEAQEEPVIQEKDKDVDALANAMAKTSI